MKWTIWQEIRLGNYSIYLSNVNLLKNKWFFKIKHWTDRSIDKFKIRLVVKRLPQIECVDYEETFSSIMRIASTYLLLALVAHLDMGLFQMDVKTVFLNGKLEEEIYID